MSLHPQLLAFIALTLLAHTLQAADAPTAPQSFRQEIARHARLETGWPTAESQLLDFAPDGSPRSFASGAWTEFRDGQWRDLPALKPSSPESFTFQDESGNTVTVPLPWAQVRAVTRTPKGTWITTPADPYLVRKGQLASQGWPSKWTVHQLAASPAGDIVIASSGGLYRQVPNGWEAIEVLDGLGRAWAVHDVLGVAFDTKLQLWFATKAGVGCRAPEGWRFFEGRDGLPWNDFTGLAPGADGEVWFATHLGAIRWDGREFHYRQGLRWLPHDDVRAISVDPRGHAWFATAGGVGMIERRTMTLAQKAAFYEDEIQRFIKRTPFGYTAEAALKKPADKTTANPHDSDNDGLWTAMYGAGECFGYAATRDPQAKTRATQAFDALRFLQKVTQGGSPAPPKGFVARTIRPIDWPDPNVGRLARDLEEQKDDKLWKAYEPRWPKSADGKWYWKSDTSSDELDGHFFFYPLYHDLVAETDAEKERVREVVRDLTDHIVSHGFTLTDIDGKPTRWAIYGPDSVNGDPDWWPERGLNSLSILSYLTVAAHVTGDNRYRDIAHELATRQGYAQNLMFAKAQYGPGSGNQSDDEMAFMCYYNLLRYGKDPAITERARYSFFAYWAVESPELNPFFNFAFAAHSLNRNVTNIWGAYPISPWPGWHDDSMATLRGFSLDRLDWSHKNSHRLDLVRLDRTKAKDLYDARGGARGHRVNGKVLPIENRHFEHWNTDPWHLDYGGNGGTLGSGTVFLLPYYMGLYHGYIEKP